MQKNRLVFLAMACLFATAALGLFLRPLLPIDETRYLDVAWEMSQSGDWLVPTKNFAIYSDKPPFLFWIINLVWMVTGVSEYAARLVGPVFACVAIWLTARLARGLWPDDDRAGGVAALSLAGLIALDRAGGASAGTPQETWAWAGFGAALALGVLIKGPVILFHLLPCAIALPLWSRAPQRWRRLPLRIGFGLLVGLGLLSLWLIPALSLGGPEYREAVLWRQSAGRLTESFAHAKPWWFYLALLPALIFPLGWGPTLWRQAMRISWRADRGLRLCLIWSLSALILFSLTSGKQIHYLVPELPAVALIAARLARGVQRFNLLPALIPLALIAIAAALAGIGIIPLGEMKPLLTPGRAVIFPILLIVATCAFAAYRRNAAAAMVLSLGMLLAFNLLIGTTRIADIYSTKQIAARIAGHESTGLAYFGSKYHAEFNFAARLTAPMAELSSPELLSEWVADNPQGLIVARMDTPGLLWPAREKVLFRNREWGIWSALDASTLIRKEF